MATAINVQSGSEMAPGEWEARVDLAAAYRLVALYGWDDLIFTHISAHVPGSGNKRFLINPFGMLFDEITASSLVKIGLDGERAEAGTQPVNPAGFLIHGAVHEARADVGCVIHLHTDATVAVSILEEGLEALSQNSLIPASGIAYHDYEGFVLSEAEKHRLVASLGQRNFMILRNHGVLTCGETIADAFLRMFFLERACRIQLLAQSSGKALRPIGREVAASVAADFAAAGGSNPGNFVWPAMLRKLDRVSPGYAD